MKTFTDIPLHRYDQVKTDNVTSNVDKYLDELNGALDSNNLPVDSITPVTHLQAPSVPQLGVSGNIAKFSSRMPTQSYFFVKRDYTLDGGASDIYDPVLSIDPDTEIWSAGFNKFSDLDTSGGFDNWPLQFDAREGMLIGCATIDWEHGNNVFNTADGPRGRGNDWWTELQVYVNNVAVARSGKIYPRRHTTQIPFSVACGSQPIQIDVRVKWNTWWAADAPSLGVTESTNFKIFSATLWCRNQYR